MQAGNEKIDVDISLVLCVKVNIYRNDVVISLVLKGSNLIKLMKPVCFESQKSRMLIFPRF